MAPYDDIKPFNLAVPDDQINQLRAKLDLTRLPDELNLPDGHEWDWGIPLAVLKPVIDYWRTKYDWRAVEERINRTLPQFTTCVESAKHGQQEVHFVHKRSNDPNAVPLIFVHGWPGNFLEVSKMIDELTNPKDPKHPSFHVVAPSLPGFVFSQRAETPGMDAVGSSYLFDRLMQKLGYKYYMAQGGDWGAAVCRSFALNHQETCLATHLNMSLVPPPTLFKNPIVTLKIALGFAGLPGGYPADDVAGIKRAQDFQKNETGYSKIQATRPQTLAVALNDSPVGLLAWIGEKLHIWTDNYPWTPEEWITWTMLYWINGPAGGLRYYKEHAWIMQPHTPDMYEQHKRFLHEWSPTPLAFSSFPKELVRLPLEWNGVNQNLVYAKKHDKGGHFAAWEVPELLVDDIRNFAQLVLVKEPRLTGAN
ncbi:hypothetical protein OPQ81_003041 [Rhizoctonia solani]|nr:hypothetical protein OPQ81_003041 [Rhizoctonia solani]